MAGERLVNLMKDAAANGIPETSRTDLVYGSVTSVSPLKIQVRNEARLELGAVFLILSPFCREFRITIPGQDTSEDTQTRTYTHNHGYADTQAVYGPPEPPEPPDQNWHNETVEDTTAEDAENSSYTHKHALGSQEIVLWRGLRVGDNVLMLRCQNGERFYVLHREE